MKIDSAKQLNLRGMLFALIFGAYVSAVNVCALIHKYDPSDHSVSMWYGRWLIFGFTYPFGVLLTLEHTSKVKLPFFRMCANVAITAAQFLKFWILVWVPTEVINASLHSDLFAFFVLVKIIITADIMWWIATAIARPIPSPPEPGSAESWTLPLSRLGEPDLEHVSQISKAI